MIKDKPIWQTTLQEYKQTVKYSSIIPIEWKYREEILKSYENKEFQLEDPNLPEDVINAVNTAIRIKDGVEEQIKLQRPMQENYIEYGEDIRIGDIVYYVKYDQYVKVVNVQKWRLQVEYENEIHKLKHTECQWYSYFHLKERVKNNLPIKPIR